ncbi:MAG: hypothetical protein A2747_01110 [Candidatus Yonathbacteria bacterium RIFCSPHIGHO2_01_FULL_44_41]|uniref:EfeO-type cupredoxin-like domain-containing protein n=1 Tax=Candidatus Yonathbacteria bacterium RIFCSPHIGHO2_02_FULL_44_14 TaxID=1802724 RepID=A0A1G2S6R8_9BACT|nr:MAG: hypothetical protein A2747_01110 [Candidatus Yonathbacteria bacterium RIFCSPHIGHO2_01_FULL_44_41]OHA80790.1 MAG: hypothetical protein A3D51_01505 [Candidatus Yonathbacteria bacterium RIFCSPHIGHO2_02_FULL_44_14]OHA82021.1 MAG: hypothetical protein A3B06_01980 [Candidatus Yonathbacteria bacterium RIFCSPLOWO2_01_FULL_43_20]
MKSTILSIIISLALIGGAFILTRIGVAPSNTPEADGPNVTIVDGKQFVEIRAKGGFLPRKSIAKAGIPTVVKFNTNGTFDCSSVVRIPSMNITRNLPPSGVTEIDLGSPSVSTLQGICGMGMYPFEIVFQD